MLLDKIKGWKIKGLSIGYILLILIDKFAFDLAGFDAGPDWINQLLIGLGIFAARDTVDSTVEKLRS